MTTLDWKAHLGRGLSSANEDLEQLLAKVESLAFGSREREYLRLSQEAWTQYRTLQADFRACHLDGGSLQGVAYLTEMTRLTAARIAELQWWIERVEGDI